MRAAKRPEEPAHRRAGELACKPDLLPGRLQREAVLTLGQTRTSGRWLRWSLKVAASSAAYRLRTGSVLAKRQQTQRPAVRDESPRNRSASPTSACIRCATRRPWRGSNRAYTSKAVVDLLGHSSVAITGDVYGHTSDDAAQHGHQPDPACGPAKP